MTTLELELMLREVINRFAAAGESLRDGDITAWRIKYAAAMRALDEFDNYRASASL